MKATTPLITLALLFVPLLADAGGKPAPPPSANTPASAEFRCPGTNCEPTDRISGDNQGPYEGNVDRYYFNTDGGSGALWLRLSEDRSVVLDLTEQDGVPSCSGDCRLAFTIVELAGATVNVNPTDENDVPLPEERFENIPIGGSSNARMLVDFRDPLGRGYGWTLRFNPTLYPGSTNVTVTRIDENTWEVEATAADRARLVSLTTKGRQVSLDEGLYIMPFKMRVTR